MGTSFSFDQLGQKLGQFAEEMQTVPRKATTAAAQVAKDVFLLSALPATGGDLKLSNVGKNGAKLGVSYKLRGAGADMGATVRATGPWQLVEFAIAPHLITSKRAGGSRRSRLRRFEEGAAGEGIGGGRRAMLRTPYGPRPYVIHPGSKNPARPWARALPEVKRIAPKSFEKATTAAMVKVFT